MSLKKLIFFIFLLILLTVSFSIEILIIIISEENLIFEGALLDLVNMITAPSLRYKIINPFVLYSFLTIILLYLWRFLLRKGAPYLSKTSINTFNILGRLILVPFFTFVYLNQFEEFSGSLIGSSALIGTIIGFSSRTTIGNIISGIYLLASRPFMVRDYIFIPNLKIEGSIKEITINYTIIDLPTGNTILIVNNSLINQTIINTRISSENNTSTFLYGLQWGLSVGESHDLAVKAIEMSARKFDSQLSRETSWFVLYVDRLERKYQINLYVNKSKTLLKLPQEFLSSLAESLELLKKPT